MSTIKLTIYRRNPETKRREVDRIATAETVFLPFGPVQDLIEAIDVEQIQTTLHGDDKDAKSALVASLAPVVMGTMKEIVPILMDTFPDVSEDEIRLCDTAEICRVVVDMLTFAVTKMFSRSAKKNMMNVSQRNAL